MFGLFLEGCYFLSLHTLRSLICFASLCGSYFHSYQCYLYLGCTLLHPISPFMSFIAHHLPLYATIFTIEDFEYHLLYFTEIIKMLEITSWTLQKTIFLPYLYIVVWFLYVLFKEIYQQIILLQKKLSGYVLFKYFNIELSLILLLMIILYLCF